VCEGIIGEFLARQKVIDETKPLLRTFVHGNGNRTVEFHDRRWLNPNQSVVEQRDLRQSVDAAEEVSA
jgi:hypothetical protein